MGVSEAVQTTAKGSTSSSSSGFVLQRKCACGGSAGFAGECAACRTNKLLGKPLQAKLRITALSDEYELEADRIAEAVMRMPDVPVDHEASNSSPVPLVHHRVNGSGTAGAGTAPQLVHDVVTSPGQPLDAAMRDFLEPRFGHNLAHVRVHADGRAHLAAESVQARAFTVGSHIVFGAGEYVPTSIASRQLLAHEVTHAIQQTGGSLSSSTAQRPSPVAHTIFPTHRAPVIARKASPAFQQQDHIADQSSTAALDQSAMAAAEVVLGAQVDALFDDQAEMGVRESAQQNRTLTRDRRHDEDEKTQEDLSSIQAKSLLPGEGEQPDQPTEELAEPQGFAFGPEPSPMASALNSEPAPATVAPSMPITSPAETSRWFNELLPSVQAEQYAQLSGALSGSFMNQAVETQEGVPELSASLEGVAELPATPDIATPPVMPSAAGQALAMAPEPVVTIPQAPALQPVDAAALPTAQAADPQALEQALKGIDQSSPIMTTLETPQIPLEGKADPAALQQLESAATGEAQQALEEAQASVMVVTPETLQPLALDEMVVPPTLSEVSAPDQPLKIEGMDTLVGYGLSPRDRAIVDAQLGPSMQEQTAGAQAELEQHEQVFDQERARLHLEADAEAEAAQAKAEEQQRLEVERGREDLAVQQERTLEQQQTAVDGALGQLAASQQENRQAIDDRSADDRALVDEAYAAAKVDANAKVEEGKAEADAAKRGTIDKVEGSSWWDWAIDTWQAVVQTVAAAVIAIGQRIVKEVAGIFDKTIAFATRVVNGAVAFIKHALSAYYDFWIGLVDRLLGDIFPGFAAAFRKAVESLKAKVFEALDTVAATYLGALRFVADTLVAGLNAGLEAYKAGVATYIALWEAIQTGQWEEVGRMVLTPILRAAGIDPEEFFATFGKIDEVIDDVIANPGLVGQNAVKALGLGFTQFGRNFIGNFIVAFVEWITGTARIRLPETFGIAGIFQIVCDVLNLTKDYLRKKAVQHLGEGAVTAVEELTESAWAFVSGGWAGLWNLVKDKLTSLVDDVVVATGTWLVEKAILVAGRWIAGLAATMGLSVILEALIALWQFVMWLKDQFQQFWMIVQSTVDSVHDFVKGNIKPAANKIEGTLQDLIVPAIDLVAKLLNISNIAKKVEQIIEAVRGVIDRAIDGVIERLKKTVKAGAKKVKAKATEVAGKLVAWWTYRETFQSKDGEEHQIYFNGQETAPRLVIASEETDYNEFLKKYESIAKNIKDIPSADEEGRDRTLIENLNEARVIYSRLNQMITNVRHQIAEKEEITIEEKEKLDQLKRDMADLRRASKSLIDTTQKEEAGTSTIPRTAEPKWDMKDGFGQRMKVSLLTFKGSPGSEPTDRVPGGDYAKLKKRRRGNGPYYVLGHLLNEDLHGPGELKNVVPIPIAGNKAHYQDVEKYVKDAVFKGASLYYKVETIPHTEADLPAFDPGSTPDQTMLHEIREIERKYVPKRFYCVAYNVDPTKDENDNPPNVFGKVKADPSTAEYALNLDKEVDLEFEANRDLYEIQGDGKSAFEVFMTEVEEMRRRGTPWNESSAQRRATSAFKEDSLTEDELNALKAVLFAGLGDLQKRTLKRITQYGFRTVLFEDPGKNFDTKKAFADFVGTDPPTMSKPDRNPLETLARNAYFGQVLMKRISEDRFVLTDKGEEVGTRLSIPPLYFPDTPTPVLPGHISREEQSEEVEMEVTVNDREQEILMTIEDLNERYSNWQELEKYLLKDEVTIIVSEGRSDKALRDKRGKQLFINTVLRK